MMQWQVGNAKYFGRPPLHEFNWDMKATDAMWNISAAYEEDTAVESTA